MGLIDTHTHLESFARRGELSAILHRAREAGLERMITIGTSTDDWELYRTLTEDSPDLVAYTVGLHPCSVGDDWAEQLAQMEAFWSAPSRPRPVALGETGLDRFHLPKDPVQAERIFNQQQAAFAESLHWAQRLDTAVVVHSRGAFKTCVDMVDASGMDWSRVVFHCFVEGPDEMDTLLARGGWGSFTGVLTYKNADSVRAALKRQGASRLMLETDAPYLTPVPHRGKPNEPAYLVHTAEVAATTLELSPEELARQSTQTARAFFRL